MLGSELRKIREKSGLTQNKFARKLCIGQSRLSKIESGVLQVTPDIENALSREINKEYRITNVNRIIKRGLFFSRDNFLKNMLTGNEVVDDIYINADWLQKLDGKEIFLKRTRAFLTDKNGKELGFLSERLDYIIDLNFDFYVKKEWLK